MGLHCYKVAIGATLWGNLTVTLGATTRARAATRYTKRDTAQRKVEISED